MLSCLVVICVGFAGDGWSYAKAESRPGHGTAATAGATTGMSTSFVGRSIAKFVERSPEVHQPPPAPQPKPEPKAAVHHVADTVKAEQKAPKTEPSKARCKRCGTQCGCGDVCDCDARQAAKPTPEKRWYVMPEDSMLEAYGYVDSMGVLRYSATRSRSVTTPIQQPAINNYPVYMQMPARSPVSCGRPGIGRG